MEVSLCQNLRSCCSIPRQIPQPRRRNPTVLVPTGLRTATPQPKLAVRCAKLGSAPEEEREIEKAAAEWVRAGRMGEKCGGEGRGLAEVLECLEREAIMGEDQGTDPNDYNRRAQIFDKSSKVFQALKERSGATSNGNNADDLSEMSSG